MTQKKQSLLFRQISCEDSYSIDNDESQKRESSAGSDKYDSLHSDKNKTQQSLLDNLEEKAQEVLHMPVPTFIQNPDVSVYGGYLAQKVIAQLLVQEVKNQRKQLQRQNRIKNLIQQDIGFDIDFGIRTRKAIDFKLNLEQLKKVIDSLQNNDLIEPVFHDEYYYSELINILNLIDLGKFQKELKEKTSLNKIDYFEICHSLKYMFLPKGESLFRVDQESDKIYYLMYGSLIATSPEIEPVPVEKVQSQHLNPHITTSTFVTEQPVSEFGAQKQKVSPKKVKKVLPPKVQSKVNEVSQMIDKLLDNTTANLARLHRKTNNYLWSDKHEETFKFFQDEKPKVVPTEILNKKDSRMAALAKKRIDQRLETAKKEKLGKEKTQFKSMIKKGSVKSKLLKSTTQEYQPVQVNKFEIELLVPVTEDSKQDSSDNSLDSGHIKESKKTAVVVKQDFDTKSNIDKKTIEVNIGKLGEFSKEDEQKINTTQTNPFHSKEEPTIEERLPYMTHLLQMENFDYEPSVINDKDLDIYDKDGQQIEVPFADIYKDNYFGELALADGLREKRLYSLWAAQDCHLFYFDRHAFKDMIKKQEQRILAERISFLNQIPLLKVLSYSQLKRFSAHLRMMHCIRQKQLYTQESKARYVYIVKEGEFRVSLTYYVKAPSFKDTKQMEVFQNPGDAKRYENDLFIKNNRLLKKKYLLGTVICNGIIGIEDIVLQNKQKEALLNGQNLDGTVLGTLNDCYTTDVKCVSQTALVIVISREEFLKFKTNAVIWSHINNLAAETIKKRTEVIMHAENMESQVRDNFKRLKDVFDFPVDNFSKEEMQGLIRLKQKTKFNEMVAKSKKMESTVAFDKQDQETQGFLGQIDHKIESKFETRHKTPSPEKNPYKSMQSPKDRSNSTQLKMEKFSRNQPSVHLSSFKRQSTQTSPLQKQQFNDSQVQFTSEIVIKSHLFSPTTAQSKVFQRRGVQPWMQNAQAHIRQQSETMLQSRLQIRARVGAQVEIDLRPETTFSTKSGFFGLSQMRRRIQNNIVADGRQNNLTNKSMNLSQSYGTCGFSLNQNKKTYQPTAFLFSRYKSTKQNYQIGSQSQDYPIQLPKFVRNAINAKL